MEYGPILDSLGIHYKESIGYFSFSSPFRSDSNPSMVLYKDNGMVIDFGGRYKAPFPSFYHKLTGHPYQQGTSEWKSLFEKPIRRRVGVQELKLDLEFDGVAVPVFESKVGLEYCYSRHMTDEFIEHFGLLYTDFCRIQGIPEGTKPPIDPTTGQPYKGTPFYRRLLIPIIEKGNVVSIEGRDVTRKAAKKCIYPRGCSVSTLFNIDELDPEQPLALCEGIMGMVQIWQSVTKNSSVFFGAQISARQKMLINRFKKVVLFPDNDEAGFDTIGNFKDFYEGEFEVAQVTKFRPDSNSQKDPGDCYPDHLVEVWNNRVPVTEFLLREAGILVREKPLW